MLNRLKYIALSAIFFLTCSFTKVVEIVNPNNFDVKSQVVEVPTKYLSIDFGDDEEIYLVKNQQGAELTSQLTHDGKLLFQVDLLANTVDKYTISKGTRKEYETQVFGRSFPERYEDFAWENDKLGFRFYGKALKKVQAPTNGLDLWYKRTTRMVLEDWYRNDISGTASYHVDHGEGCDPYGVGTTLGAGAMAPFINDSIIRNENFDVAEVLDNGPLRVTAKLIYPTLNIDGKSVEDVRTVSLDAGSYFTKVTQSYGDAQMTVAAGIVKRAQGDSIIVGANNSSLIYAEPVSKANGQIYVGLVFPDQFKESVINSYQVGKGTFSHVLAVKDYDTKPVTYYIGFGWSKSEFPLISDFQNYIQHFSSILKEPLQVRIF